jgi:2-amino-4-hydroxy-6-hydroxymethyldihydropteridine diphosphokinase
VTTLALSIGSNIEAESNIRAALSALTSEYSSVRCSTTYESQAVGFEGDNFLNLVILVETDKNLDQVASFLKGLEDELGRDRQQVKFSGRTMDIDILLFGSESGICSGIQLPRPEITENAFVLQPLAEVLPDEIHPATGKTYQGLWQDYDKSRQKLWSVEKDWFQS